MSWYWLRDQIVKVRKHHSCRLCGESIEKGEICVMRTGTDDGIHTFYMHKECEEATVDWDSDDWEVTSPGEMERPASANLSKGGKDL